MKQEDPIGRKIRLIQNRIHKQMEAKRIANEGDLTGTQRWCIVYLKHNEARGIYQKDIEQEFNVSGATASNMLSSMERRGLIVREAVSHDARLKKISLTPRARGIMDRAEEDMHEMERTLLAGFNIEETEKLNEYLDRIMENIGVEEN